MKRAPHWGAEAYSNSNDTAVYSEGDVDNRCSVWGNQVVDLNNLGMRHSHSVQQLCTRLRESASSSPLCASVAAKRCGGVVAQPTAEEGRRRMSQGRRVSQGRRRSQGRRMRSQGSQGIQRSQRVVLASSELRKIRQWIDNTVTEFQEKLDSWQNVSDTERIQRRILLQDAAKLDPHLI